MDEVYNKIKVICDGNFDYDKFCQLKKNLNDSRINLDAFIDLLCQGYSMNEAENKIVGLSKYAKQMSLSGCSYENALEALLRLA